MGLTTLQAAQLPEPILLTQVPASLPPAIAISTNSILGRPDLFDGARIVLVSTQGQVRVLSDGFAAACDPDLSFDGQRLLFAGKKNRDSQWAIWEMSLDGRSPRQVAQADHDCRSPVYLSTLFTLNSPEPWFILACVGRNRTLNERGTDFSTSLHSIRLDGSEPRRLTFSPNQDVDPFQMIDGRLLFSSLRYPAGEVPSAGRLSLFAAHIDGMDIELYGATQGRRFQRMGCATRNGLVVFVESDSPTWDGAGQLGSVRAQRPHHSYRALTDDPALLYLYPSGYGTNSLLVSRRPAADNAQSGLCCYELSTGRVTPVFDSPDYHDLQAKPVRSRPIPDGHSTVVETKYTTGKLYGLNTYLADARLQPDLTPGSIQRLRVIEGVPANPPAQPSAPALTGSVLGRRLLGEAPVEKDGSFHIEIPADIPLQLQALDSNGVALATCGWLWVKQKENLGCIGCHEDPELIPENLYVAALARSANNLTLPPDKRRSVSFLDHALPVLHNRCASADCHGGSETPLNLPLSADHPNQDDARKAYAALLAPDRNGAAKYVEPGRARASFLAWQIVGRNLSRSWDRPAPPPPDTRKIRQMPPAKAPALTGHERRTLLEWIDLGAAWEAPQAPATATAQAAPQSK